MNLKDKLTNLLINLNYNKKFNIFYNVLTIVSIVYVLFLTTRDFYFNFFKSYPVIYFFIDIIFFSLFSIELIIRYWSIGDFRKFFKVYFWDIVALLGWIPVDYIVLHFFYGFNEAVYLHDLALLRLIRIIRLITIFKIFGIIEKEINFLLRNIIKIFVITVLVILVGSVMLNQILEIDIFEALKWAFYVVFTGEIPEGLPDKTQKYLIGIFLIIANGILFASIIGTIASFIMERYKKLNIFDNIPSYGNLVIIINYDKEMITSIIKEYIKTIYYAIIDSTNINTKIVLISKLSTDDVDNLNEMMNSTLKKEHLHYLTEFFFIVNKNILETSFYNELEKLKDRIEKIFILPDERESDEYHQDINTAFIASNIVRTLGTEFSKTKVIAITNTDIVNIDEINVIRQYELISKIINMKIFLPSASLFISNFFTPVGYKIKEFYIKNFSQNELKDVNNLFDLIEYIKNTYDAVILGYITKHNEYKTLVNKLYSPKKYQDCLKSLKEINLNDVYSIICIL